MPYLTATYWSSTRFSACFTGGSQSDHWHRGGEQQGGWVDAAASKERSGYLCVYIYIYTLYIYIACICLYIALSYFIMLYPTYWKGLFLVPSCGSFSSCWLCFLEIFLIQSGVALPIRSQASTSQSSHGKALWSCTQRPLTQWPVSRVSDMFPLKPEFVTSIYNFLVNQLQVW